MVKKILLKVNEILNSFKNALQEFKRQPAYEINKISIC